jgi:hypothetical protein
VGAVAEALPTATPTAAELTARGARVRIVVEGLTTPRVELSAPRDVAPDLRAALGWRTEAMLATLRAPMRRAGEPLRAVPGLVLPKLPEVAWSGWREQFGRRIFVKLSAQRQVPGLCDSCGEAIPGETGDCDLCNAARVAALRAAGLLPPPAPLALPEWPTETAWRASLVPAQAPAAAPPAWPTWTCKTCSKVLTSTPDPELECGPCELRRADVMSTASLGGHRRHA